SHRIRHSCATELHRQHVDALTIARHLGHHDLKQVARYAEVGIDSRREAMAGLDDRSDPGRAVILDITADLKARAIVEAPDIQIGADDIERAILAIEQKLAAMTPAERASEYAAARR